MFARYNWPHSDSGVYATICIFIDYGPDRARNRTGNDAPERSEQRIFHTFFELKSAFYIYTVQCEHVVHMQMDQIVFLFIIF